MGVKILMGEFENTIQFTLPALADPNFVFLITVFLPAFLLLRTIKRAIPSLLGGG